jgi:hypothetical protein
MRKRNFKEFYVIINTKDFTINLCSTKSKAAEIMGIHRTTLDSLKERGCFNSFLIVLVKEQ